MIGVATVPSFVDGIANHAADFNFLGTSRPRGAFTRAAAQSIPNSVTTVITGDTLGFDSDPTMWAVTPNPTQLQLNTPGTWMVIGLLNWAVSSVGSRFMDIRKNSAGSSTGGVSLLNDGRQPVSTINTVHSASYLVPGLIAGDYVEIFGWQTSGGALTVTAGLQAIWFGS